MTLLFFLIQVSIKKSHEHNNFFCLITENLNWNGLIFKQKSIKKWIKLRIHITKLSEFLIKSLNEHFLVLQSFNLIFYIFLTDSSFMLIHVDGNDLRREGNWSYHDGSSVPFSPLFWRPTEPNGGMNENCLGLLNGTLCDINCLLSTKFVCERYFSIWWIIKSNAEDLKKKWLKKGYRCWGDLICI